jgi:hypothetical protein
VGAIRIASAGTGSRFLQQITALAQKAAFVLTATRGEEFTNQQTPNFSL